MARVTGNDGNATLPSGHNGVLNTWRASYRPVVSNVTGFSDSTNQRNRVGLPAISGSASGALAFNEGSSAPGAGSEAAGGASMTLTVATASTWAFTGAISGISIDVVKLGDTRVTFDFVGGDADDFAESWDEGP